MRSENIFSIKAIAKVRHDISCFSAFNSFINKMARVHILIATISFVVVVLARPQSEQFQPAQVVREKNNNDGSGKYLFT